MRGPAFVATLVFVLASCAPTATTPAPPSANGQASRTAAPYLSTDLTDVRNGEHFALASLVGKTVIVEGMAVW